MYASGTCKFLQLLELGESLKDKKVNILVKLKKQINLKSKKLRYLASHLLL